jgi:ParB family chromosome partitioning protein
MSTRKSFSIPKDLASGIRQTVQTATDSLGQLRYDYMPLDLIECDPENPRKLFLQRDELTTALSKEDPLFTQKQSDLQALAELAESIKKVGVRNAIEVYKVGTKYRIISGERRYLASVLAAQKQIPVHIVQKPDELKLRYMQWAENINREDLSLYEKYNNLNAIQEAFKATNMRNMTLPEFQQILGTSTAQTYRYFALLNMEADLIELIKNNRLSNLKAIDAIQNIRDPEQKKKIIQTIGDTNVAVSHSVVGNLLQKFQTKKPAGQAKLPAISLGKINNRKLAKELFLIVMQDSRLMKYHLEFEHINWASDREVSQAFKKLLKLLEKELI